MHCKSCRYSLKNLSTPCCPECGRKFDPKNPDTFGYTTFRSILFRVLVCCAFVYPIFFIVFFVYGTEMLMSELQDALILALIGTFFIVPVFLLLALSGFRRRAFRKSAGGHP